MLLSHYSALAMEVAPHNITVSGHAPGAVGTAMWDLIDEKLGKPNGVKKVHMFKQYSSALTAAGSTSVPKLVGKCVSYLIEPYSDYITGHLVGDHIYLGGETAHLNMRSGTFFRMRSYSGSPISSTIL